MIKFGINSTDLESAAQALGALLNMRFARHESDFRGGDYYRAESQQGTLFLQKNYDPVDQEPFESGWPADQVVIYLDGAEDQAWHPLVAVLQAAQGTSVTELG